MAYAILIIEDEETLGRNIARYLERHGHEARRAASAEDGLEQFEQYRPDLVLLDLKLPGMDGLEALRRLKQLDPDVKVVIMTAHGSIQVAITAIKAGAYDYVSKPIVLGDLKRLIDKALGEERLSGALSYYRRRDASAGGLAAMIGSSSAMTALKEGIGRLVENEHVIADGPPPAVLITGETGSGKELVARAIHHEGPRREAPFIELNCAALPAQLVEDELFGHERGAFTDAKERKLGLVEAAHGGTLFLDEIGDVEPSIQVKLLKLLEDRRVRRLGGVREREVDVRIVAATNQPLEDLVQAGRIRSDLYFRLRIIQFAAPPLRARGDDVLRLAAHFLGEFGRRYRRGDLRLTADAERALLAHSWPGNVRELRNVIEQAVLLSRGAAIDVEHLALSPLGSRAANGGDGAAVRLPPSGLSIEEVERSLLEQALAASAWNVTAAARLLGLSRDTLRYRMDKFGLRRPA